MTLTPEVGSAPPRPARLAPARACCTSFATSSFMRISSSARRSCSGANLGTSILRRAGWQQGFQLLHEHIAIQIVVSQQPSASRAFDCAIDFLKAISAFLGCSQWIQGSHLASCVRPAFRANGSIILLSCAAGAGPGHPPQLLILRRPLDHDNALEHLQQRATGPGVAKCTLYQGSCEARTGYRLIGLFLLTGLPSCPPLPGVQSWANLGP